MADRRITCIIKPYGNNTHEAITTVGGSWGQTTRSQAVSEINSGTHTYYVQDNRGNRVGVGVYKINYLRTYADNVWTDNLLSLPTCS